MGLIPEKCTFKFKVGKFLGFYMKERGIEANSNKCRAVIKMEATTMKKEIMKLNGMLTSLNKFISRSAQQKFPFYKLLNKEAHFDWTPECEHAFITLKYCVSERMLLSLCA